MVFVDRINDLKDWQGGKRELSESRSVDALAFGSGPI
jgi:hypothetical protein